MAYQQAQIPVQKTEEFEHLRAAIERVFAPGAVEKYFKKLQDLTVQQAQWYLYLQEFNYQLEYKPEKTNGQANTLS